MEMVPSSCVYDRVKDVVKRWNESVTGENNSSFNYYIPEALLHLHEKLNVRIIIMCVCVCCCETATHSRAGESHRPVNLRDPHGRQVQAAHYSLEHITHMYSEAFVFPNRDQQSSSRSLARHLSVLVLKTSAVVLFFPGTLGSLARLRGKEGRTTRVALTGW